MRIRRRQTRKTSKREPWALSFVFILMVGGIDNVSASDYENEELPDKALLEFMLEFADIDDEGFELLIERGKKDSASQIPKKDEESNQEQKHIPPEGGLENE